MPITTRTNAVRIRKEELIKKMTKRKKKKKKNQKKKKKMIWKDSEIFSVKLKIYINIFI